MSRFSSNGSFIKLLIISTLMAGVVTEAEDGDMNDIFSSIEDATGPDCEPMALTCDCTGHQDCRSVIEGEVECRPMPSSQECHCVGGHVGLPFERVCRPVVEEVGGACQVEEQCNADDGLGELSRCLRGSCECFDTHSPTNPKPTEFDPATRKCIYGPDPCDPIAIDCDCTGQGHQVCRDAIDGEVECRTIQSNQECRCSEGHAGKSGERACRPIVDEFGGACEADEQCTAGGLGELSRCVEDGCYCFDTKSPDTPEQTEYDNSTQKCIYSPDRCDPKALYCDCTGQGHQVCRAAIEGEVECRNIQSNQECRCAPDHIGKQYERKCRPLAKVEGADCEVQEQCTDEDGLDELSECTSEGKCVCKDTLSAADHLKPVKYDAGEGKCIYDNSANLMVPSFVILLGLTISKLLNV